MNADIITAEIALYKNRIREISDFIYNHPELGYEEIQAAELQRKFLQDNGLEISIPCDSLPTSFDATTGNGSPHIAILSEYDALPQIGHACGHNLIMSSALAAGIAVKNIMEKFNLPGTLHIIGTPGEEAKGGKVIMIDQGVFDGIDCALICHPYSATLPDQGMLAVSRFDIDFYGESAHAATAPHDGKNALDAMTLFFNGINAWRQHIKPNSRVHGVIKEGGNMPNIIPDHTSAFFYVRSTEMKTQEEMETRFAKIAEGAAMMTDTVSKVVKQPNAYLPEVVNKPLNRYFTSHAAEFGLEVAEENPQGLISSDFGNVSSILPGANWFIKVTKDNSALHTEAFKQAVCTDYAFDQTMKIAAIMASTAIETLENSNFLQQIKEAFANR